jgi:hypothetical protein
MIDKLANSEFAAECPKRIAVSTFSPPQDSGTHQ